MGSRRAPCTFLYFLTSCGFALAAALATQAVLRRLDLFKAGTPLGASPGTLEFTLVTIIIFLAAKLGGQAAWLLFRSKETFFFEDLLVDLSLYGSMGLLAAIAIPLANELLGGPVPPLVPAMALHGALVLSGGQPGSPEPEI